MKEIKYVPDPLNEQASILVDAQTDIKTAVKQGVLAGNTAEAIKEACGDYRECGGKDTLTYFEVGCA